MADLDVVELYAGEPGTTKIVVGLVGGIFDDGNGRRFHNDVRPVDHRDLVQGDSVMLFAGRNMRGRPADPSPHVTRLFDAAETLERAGEVVMVAQPHAIYTYDLKAGTGRSPEIDQWVEDIDDLRDDAARPCAHLADRMHVSEGGHSYFGVPIETQMAEAEIVVRGVITQTLRPFYNTSDGGIPRPRDTGAGDDEVDGISSQIFQAVVFDVSRQYKGREVDGYIVMRSVDASPACPNFTYDQTPRVLTGEVGDTGFLLMSRWPDGLMDDPPPWLRQLIAVRDELEAATGRRYQIASDVNWYRIDGDEAWSELDIEPIPLARFEAAAEQAGQ